MANGKKIAYYGAAVLVYIIMMAVILKMKIGTGVKIAVLTGALILFGLLDRRLRTTLGIAEGSGDGS